MKKFLNILNFLFFASLLGAVIGVASWFVISFCIDWYNFDQKVYDEHFKPIVQKFHDYEYRSGDNPFSIPIVFGDFPKSSNILGMCKRIPLKKLIVINTKFWSKMRDWDKHALIHHELGHCILGRGHTDTRYHGDITDILVFIYSILDESDKPELPHGCPASIMHPTNFTALCLSHYKYYYSAELFNPSLTYLEFVQNRFMYQGRSVFPK